MCLVSMLMSLATERILTRLNRLSGDVLSLVGALTCEINHVERFRSSHEQLNTRINVMTAILIWPRVVQLS